MNKMKSARILHLEDSDVDARIIQHVLNKAKFSAELIRVDDKTGFITQLNSQSWDAIISDYAIPGFSGMEALKLARETDPDIPFLIVSGAIGETLAVELIKAGANDYISKQSLTLLAPTLERELKSAQSKRLHYSLESLAQTTLEAIADAVVTCDAHCKIHTMNPAAEKLFHTTLTNAQGKAITDIAHIIHEPDGQKINHTDLISIRHKSILKIAHLDNNAAIESCFVEVSSSKIYAPTTESSAYVIVFHDITETKRLLHQLSHEASHDALTNLINRREFEKRLSRFLAKASAHRAGVLLYLDLDQFKIVNDTCGHQAGDELLRQVAGLLRSQLRERDTLARVGGDEFALLMEHCDLLQANRVAKNILSVVNQFRFCWEENLFQIGVSIGVVPIERSDISVNRALKLADHACYAAKEAGRNRYLILKEEDPNLIQRQSDLRWVSAISDAIEKNKFQLYKQKILALSKNNNEGDHFEILLRFIDPLTQKGISPAAFLRAAERYDLMATIDHWVVSNTLKWFEKNPAELKKLACCSINLAGRTIGNEAEAQRIIEMVESSVVPAEKLCFEVTETAAIANSSIATCHINYLRKLGCKFALDDFGTGLASFNYLRTLPVDILKIDGSFIMAMIDNPIDLAMVRSINEVGHILGKKTVAEFVSTKKLLDCVTGLGIDFAQGYAIEKPTPLIAALAFA